MKIISVKSKSKKRVGRGLSAGGGKTAGRGTKGQRSRSGFNLPRKFEGGQTPLSMRLAKLPGFTSHKPKATIVTLDAISANFKDGEEVTKALLVEKNLVKKTDKVKVLNNGTLTVSVTFAPDVRVSKSIVIPEKKAAVKASQVEETKTEKVQDELVAKKSAASDKVGAGVPASTKSGMREKKAATPKKPATAKKTVAKKKVE